MWSTKARENACERITIAFGFSSDWITKWREVSNHKRSVIMQNKSKYELLTILKRKLFYNLVVLS